MILISTKAKELQVATPRVGLNDVYFSKMKNYTGWFDLYINQPVTLISNNLLKFDGIMSWQKDFHKLSELYSLTKHILIFFAENFFGWLVSGGFIWTCRACGTRGIEGQLLPPCRFPWIISKICFLERFSIPACPPRFSDIPSSLNWNRVKAGLRASIIKRWFEVFLKKIFIGLAKLILKIFFF